VTRCGGGLGGDGGVIDDDLSPRIRSRAPLLAARQLLQPPLHLVSAIASRPLLRLMKSLHVKQSPSPLPMLLLLLLLLLVVVVVVAVVVELLLYRRGVDARPFSLHKTAPGPSIIRYSVDRGFRGRLGGTRPGRRRRRERAERKDNFLWVREKYLFVGFAAML